MLTWFYSYDNLTI